MLYVYGAQIFIRHQGSNQDDDQQWNIVKKLRY